MKTIRPRSWKGFVQAIEKIRQDYGTYRQELENGEVHETLNRILFRGQSNSSWPLATTLERKTESRFHVLHYMYHATGPSCEIESFTGDNWNVPDYPQLEQEINDYQDAFRVVLPSYDYLVYLRHHGYPSPLLDWTESPFIAAYFAFVEASQKSLAVYCYIERPLLSKGGQGGDPMITVKGPFVKTHKRHFAQKAWYTVATKWDYRENCHYFCPHEQVFNREDPRQDVLIKIILPQRLRKEALKTLNDYNINHFTLFQSEDSLIKAIEIKEFDINGV